MTLPTGIRRAHLGDINAISQIELLCFPGPAAYTRKQLAYLALKANSSCFVDECDGRIRGFIILVYRRKSSYAGIETVDVDPEFQGKGVGVRLLAAAEADMRIRGVKKVKLEVSERNDSAVNLYKKMGFFEQERLVNYYIYKHHGTRNALRMVKHLL